MGCECKGIIHLRRDFNRFPLSNHRVPRPSDNISGDLMCGTTSRLFDACDSFDDPAILASTTISMLRWTNCESRQALVASEIRERSARQ